MKQKLNLPRLLLASTIALLVGGVAAAQLISEQTGRRLPETAMAIFPANATAFEAAASSTFTKALRDPEQPQPAAAAARDLAIEAYRRDPSRARAIALLALGERDLARRDALALVASRSNRRDLTLQGIVLEAHLKEGNYSKVVETIDQMLRVHPAYRGEFYPILGQALRDERAVPVFARLLDGSSKWHEYFFTNYAITQVDLMANVARLREGRDLAGPEFDRKLVEGLVMAGEGEAAMRLYARLSPQASGRDADGGLGWAAEFPPFDWKFTDESDFRAQVSRDGERLELFARPGKGGIIAQRILPVPKSPFMLALKLSAESPSKEESVRIELSCPGATQPFFVQPLALGANRLSVDRMPECEQMVLAINARAFTGRPTLRGEMSEITITPR